MGEQPTEPDELTWIGGRPVEAFISRGDTTMIDIACERIGPPVGVGAAPGTSFRVTLRNVPVLTQNAATTEAVTTRVTIQRQASSLWAALRDARCELDSYGWLLSIAASRIDRWSVYGERRPDATTVHPFDDLSRGEGMLQDAPPETLATVVAQYQAYQQWLAAQNRAQDPTPGAHS